MTVRLNTAMQDRQADSAADAPDTTGTLKFYSGAQPASANDAASGTLLCTISLPNPAFGSSSSGSAAKSGTWSGTVTAAGTAGWARLANSGDTLRMDMSVGTTGTDAVLDSVTFEVDGTVVIDTCSVTQPAS